MRLNKYISETGVCSRREADKWIEAGRITCNGLPAVLGTQVVERDEVRVDGELIGAKQQQIYIVLNKPVGITCTTETHVDGNIIDLIGHTERIFPIGRLDKDSEGLILLTNNGDIVNEILRAENNHEKEYLVTVDRPVTDLSLKLMADGVKIMGEITKACQVSRVDQQTFRMILTQGLNRQIRRMCSALGYQTRRLQRVRIINIRLDHMPVGTWRHLTEAEVSGLMPSRSRAGQLARNASGSRPSDQSLPLVARHSGSSARAASQRKKSAP